MTQTNIDVTLADLDKTFQELKEQFKKSKKYWQLGHSFDTIIDYFSVNPDAVRDFIPIALDRYHNYIIDQNETERKGLEWCPPETYAYESTPSAPWWYDDYCWWGIAGLKASKMKEFGEFAPVFAGISRYCWDTVFRMAPNNWTNIVQSGLKEHFKDFEPRFDGGVWNYFYSKYPISFIPDTPLDPTTGCLPDSLRGIQNTVTNGLFLVLSARLYLETKSDPIANVQNCLIAAQNELKFLFNWMGVKEPNYSLFYMQVPESGLVRERVSTFKDLKQHVRAYDSNLFWLGDQGLIIGGLLEMMSLLDKNSPDYRACVYYLEAIVTGVNRIMTGADNYLYPWLRKNVTPPPGGSPGGDDNDYLTGIAVYFRYLLRIYESNPDLKQFLIKKNIPFIAQFNINNKYCNPANYEKDEDLFAVLTNKLAVQVAAYKMSK